MFKPKLFSFCLFTALIGFACASQSEITQEQITIAQQVDPLISIYNTDGKIFPSSLESACLIFAH